MVIPQVNIRAYRRQYEPAQGMPARSAALLCAGGAELRTVGTQVALISGREIGSPFRGYGAYLPNAPRNFDNVYCPQYYNQKNHARGGGEWFI